MTTILHIEGLTKKHGNRAVLDGVSVSVGAGQKIGVVGRNGAGKSTLIRIIAGEEEADGGTVMRQPGARIGYLEQHEPFTPDESVLAFLERRSGKPEWKCATAAGQFQLKKELLTKPLGELSEGLRMRARLADMILQDPDFLLLDEPTNYLDLHTVLLLERFLQKTQVGFLLVSHDREFLKNTCDATLDVERGKAFLFPGDIESYLGYKEQEEERKLRENKKIDAQRRHLQSFVDRFRAKASKASAAQSKLKQIEKLKPIEIAHRLKTVSIRIPRDDKMKKGLALVCENMSIGYAAAVPPRVVAEGVTLDVERGRHVAVLGDNGQGKTTFLRTIAEQLPAMGGDWKWGQGLEVAYYGQKSLAAMDHHDRVDAFLLRAAAPDVLPEEVLAMAGSFLFTQDDLEKRVGVLSGGERARLCLAGLLLSKKPVFLLDEPTNHLDFETVEALGEALASYPGTIFFVSHNRTFVSLLATAILEVGGGRIRSISGTYDEYVWRLEQEIDTDIPRPSIVDGVAMNARALQDAERAAAEEREAEKERRREQRDELKEQKRRLQKVEARVIELEDARGRLLDRIAAQPTVYSQDLHMRLAEVTKDLTAAEAEWVECTSAIEWLSRE